MEETEPPATGKNPPEPWYHLALFGLFLFGLVASLATGRLLFLYVVMVVAVVLILSLTFSPKELGGLKNRRTRRK